MSCLQDTKNSIDSLIAAAEKAFRLRKRSACVTAPLTLRKGRLKHENSRR